ncbi:MAG TPA: nucleotide pyrophosphohydrolase [Candidatus Latescibacteria bacterium]|nr:nucleotide pyrophosphohydrolase [Spirochaetota bacterium]HPI23437.1 nucleotide pyrophosphohydrolase [Spirochaetota bacterium]HPU86398.1 nucleotide pyrophosphohydrolase [Candidatus Latescibacterota bacterium]
MDESTPIANLKKMALEFRDARNWRQFHDLRNLATGLSIESAELQEIFLWKNDADIARIAQDESVMRRLREEMADIFIYLLYLSEATGIDLADAVADKIELNGKKYPVEKSYNSSKKYTEL